MLTVLLATRNRAGILRDVLEAYCQLESPAAGWRVVVIDNGSTDATPLVVASFAGRLPLHFMTERKLGKNFALNTGLGLVEGDLTVFTDDDAFPRPDWLVKLKQAADGQAAYSMFGGAIVPRWETPPPAWIGWIEDTGPVYTLTDPSLEEGPITSYLVFGPNMAIRTRIFESGVRFDSSIGPSGTDYPMGSETELLVRLERAGHKAWYVEGARVEHFIRNEQLRQDWVLQRAIRWGRGRFRISRNPKLLFGVPRYLFRDLPKEAAQIAAAGILLRKDSLFRARWRFNILRGMAIEARRMAHEPEGMNRIHTGTEEVLRGK